MVLQVGLLCAASHFEIWKYTQLTSRVHAKALNILMVLLQFVAFFRSLTVPHQCWDCILMQMLLSAELTGLTVLWPAGLSRSVLHCSKVPGLASEACIRGQTEPRILLCMSFVQTSEKA